MMDRSKTMARAVLVGLTLLAAVACDNDPTNPEAPARYTVEVSGERFVVEVSTASQIAEMEARLASGAVGVINGQLAAGTAYNHPWSWHFDPATVHAVDLSIELCDGRPSMVEADLDYWLDTVGQFCPWGATVVNRLP